MIQNHWKYMKEDPAYARPFLEAEINRWKAVAYELANQLVIQSDPDNRIKTRNKLIDQTSRLVIVPICGGPMPVKKEYKVWE